MKAGIDSVVVGDVPANSRIADDQFRIMRVPEMLRERRARFEGTRASYPVRMTSFQDFGEDSLALKRSLL